jgi:hypothetical protein
MNNFLDQRIVNTDTYLGVHQSHSASRISRAEKIEEECDLVSAKGKLCEQIFKETEGLVIPGIKQLVQFLNNKRNIPKAWKGRRVFFLGDAFKDKDGYQIVYYLDCCHREVSEYGYGICSVKHEHPFNEHDFFAVFDEIV